MFEKLTKFVDKRNSLPKHKTLKYGKRSLSVIKYIAIHHSATTGGSAENFANYHISKGWPGIGYHFVIEKDGTIVWCNDLNTISYHVGGYNTPSIGICMIGDFTKESPTKEQLESVYALVKILMDKFNIPLSNVKGHREFPNQATSCPGLSMDNFRKELGKVNNVNIQTKQNNTNAKKYPGKLFKLTTPYMRDAKGETYIKDIQKAVGLTGSDVDGIYGPKTEQYIKNFQKKKGLVVDGIVGPKTWEALFG